MVDVRIENGEAVVRLPGASKSLVYPIPAGMAPDEMTRRLQDPVALAGSLTDEQMQLPDVRVNMAKNTPLGAALRARVSSRMPDESQQDFDVRQGGALTGDVSADTTDLSYAQKMAVPFLQGATSGYSDQMIAEVLSKMRADSPEEQKALYEYYMTTGKATLDAIREEEPLMALIAEGAGLLMPAGLIGKAGKMLAPMTGPTQRFAESESPLAAATRAGAVGAVEGLAYAGGTSDSGVPDPVEAAESAAIGAAGGVLGTAAAGGVKRLATWFAALGNKGMRQLGIDDRVRRLIVRASGDDPEAIRLLGDKIRQRGSAAMPVDVMPGGVDLLDSILTTGGPAASGVRSAVNRRASDAAENIRREMDDTLGELGGASDQALEAAIKDNPARALYTAAWQVPVDYSSNSGRRILEMVETQLPADALAAAKKTARTRYGESGDPNAQFFADIGADGAITFKRAPNAQELDSVIRAMKGVSDAAYRAGNSDMGEAYYGTAKELRTLLRRRDQNPAYDDALKTFSNFATMRDARDIGRTILSDSTWAQDITPVMRELGSSQRSFVKKGLREYLEREQGKVKAAITNPSATDHAEAVKAFKLLSSRENRKKVGSILGEDTARTFFKNLEEEAVALQLKALVGANSRTAVRQYMHDLFKELSSEGLVRSMRAEGVLRGATDSLLNLALKDAPEKEIERILQQTARLLTRQTDQAALFDHLASAQQQIMRAEAAGDTAYSIVVRPLVGVGMSGAREGTRERFDE